MMASIPRTMKALVKKSEVEGYVYEDVPVPDPTGDEVLIKVDSVSICGSDINLYRWNDVARVIATIPFVPGHECAGTVVKCGPKAKIALGAKVGVENHYYCGDCHQCRYDDRSICRNMGQFGHGKQTQYGGCSEYTIVPAKYIYVLTRDLSADEIAMLEPLGVSHNAVERLRPQGEEVLIIGCGPIGLLAISVARAMGATRVIGADIEESRLQLAKKMGADVVVNTAKKNLKENCHDHTTTGLDMYKLWQMKGELVSAVVKTRGGNTLENAFLPWLESHFPVFVMEHTSGLGLGRICECTGAPVMVNSSFSMLRKGGRIVMVGLPKQPLHVENVLQDIVFKSLTLKTIHGRRIFHTWEEIEKLVADKKVDVNAIITHKFPMSKYEEAFQTLFSGKACKIVMEPAK